MKKFSDSQTEYDAIRLMLDALCKNTAAETFVKVWMETKALITPSKRARKRLSELGIENLN